MNEKFIPYGKQQIDQEDINAVVETLKSDWITQGPKITEFEKAIAERVNTKHGVAVATGTAALHCSCLALGVSAGDEVITSPLTFLASGNSACFCGANVKFVDIREDTYCIDYRKLESAITDKTKVIIPVDFAGQPCDMDEINSIAKKHNIKIIHDCAHSLGAFYKEKPVGSLADITIFSFHPVKHIATGEGGMVVTDDDVLAKRLRLFRTHGMTNKDNDMILTEQSQDNENQFNKKRNHSTRAPWYYEMHELGFNYRVTDIQCALGLSQLNKLNGFLKRRQEIVDMYNRAFSKSEHLIVPKSLEDRQNAWHLYVLRINFKDINKTRRQIFEELRSMNIGVHVHYIPLHLQPFYRDRFGYKRGDFPQAEAYYDSALTIPLFPSMSDDDCARVIKSVLNVVQ